MKLSVNKAKLTGLWATNCATIQLVLILNFTFGPEKLSGLSRNGPQGRVAKNILRLRELVTIISKQ